MISPLLTIQNAVDRGAAASGLRWSGMLGLCVVLMPFGFAQEDPVAVQTKPSWQIVPTVSAGFVMTDNVRPGLANKQSDFVTTLTPGLRIEGKGGRVSGNLNFNWQQNFYANESRYNSDHKFLSAIGKAELIEEWLFLDATANITQQPSSVFGTQSVGNDLINRNLSDTTTYQLSPYMKGALWGQVEYELRYRNSSSKSDSGLYSRRSGVDAQIWSGRLAGATPLAFLGWMVDADQTRVSFGSNRDTKSSRLIGTLEFRLDPQFKVNLSAGRESDNYSNYDLQSRTVSGYGFDWAPTERTTLSVNKERRSFGDGHRLDFQHRTGQTAWILSDKRSAIIPAQQLVATPVSTAYDLLFLQLESSIPDPVARAQAVSNLLFLAGIPANSVIYGNILTSQPFIQRSQLASVAITGVNNTVTFSMQRSRSNRIGTGVGLLDEDFLNTANIRQSGLSGSWAHKLSPDTTVTLNMLTSHSKGDTLSQDTRLRSLTLLYTTKLGPKTTASLGLRQNNFDNASVGIADYTEHAITGTLSASF